MIKKLCFMFAMLTCILSSCSDGDEIAIEINLAFKDLFFDVEGSEQTISFNVNSDWSLYINSTAGDKAWCTPSITSGNKGAASVKFMVGENTDYGDRSVVVTIIAGSVSESFTITQKGNQQVPFELKQKEYILPLQGSRFALFIKHHSPYKILDKSGYIFQEDYTLKTDSVDVLIFSIGDHDSNREGTIVIANERETYKETIYVKQQATEETLHNGNGNSANSYGTI